MYLKDWKTSDKLIKTQVIMGQGESGYNLDHLKTYIEIAKNKNALDYGRTRITVSSVGLFKSCTSHIKVLVRFILDELFSSSSSFIPFQKLKLR